MLAVLNDHEEIVRLVCEAGDNREITGAGAPGFNGYIALDLAKRAGRSRIAELIRKARLAAN